MALKRNVTTLEEVAEAFRGLYTQQTDGTYRLDVDGDEDVSGLKSALSKERESRETLDRELKKLRKDIDGLDPAKAREAMARLQEIEEKKLIDAGQVEEVIKQRLAAREADFAGQVKTFQAQLTERDDALAKTTQQLRSLMLDGAIQQLALKKGVKASAVADAVARLTVVGIGAANGQPPIKWDVKDGKIVALRGDQTVYGKDATQAMPLEEGFEILASEAGHLFEESKGAGAPGGDRQMGGSGRDVLLNREQAKDMAVYRQAREQAEKQGGTVIVSPPPAQ